MHYVVQNIKYLIKLPSLLVNALFGYDFFISYAHADGTDYSEKLSEDLTNLGFETHLDTRDYHAGADLDRLTEVRLRNSRNLVVVCRPFALQASQWVRREIDAFERRGQSVRLIDVEGAVKHSLIEPNVGTTAEWLANSIAPASDKTRADMLLRIEDRSGQPDHSERLPGLNIAEALQRAFTDRRRRTVRLQALTGVVVVFGILTIALAAASIFAVSAAARAEREALVAQLQLSAADAEKLSTTPDTGLALQKVLADVVRAREGLGYVPSRTRLALWRVLNTVRDLRVFTTEMAQILAIGWDTASERIITLERNGGVSAYDIDGTRVKLIEPNGEDNARISFSESGTAIQRAEGEAWGIYSLGGELLLNHHFGLAGAKGHELRDIEPNAQKLLWVDDDRCLRVTAFDKLPAGTDPLHCIEEDEFDLIRFAGGSDEIFYSTDNGTVRRIDARSGTLLAENPQLLPFNTWRLRDDARELVAFRANRMIRMNGDLEIIAGRSLDGNENENGDFVSGVVLWEDDRILTVQDESEQMMQVFSLDLEPASAPFRLHASSAIGVAPSQRAFLSAGYLDNMVRMISARARSSEMILHNSELEVAQIAYCPRSTHLVLGDFDGSIHLLDPSNPAKIQSLSLMDDELIDAVICLDNNRWAATVGGRMFTSMTFDPTEISTIDVADDIAWHLAKYGTGIMLGSQDDIFLLSEQTLVDGRVLLPDDALQITLPGDEHSMIFSVAADRAQEKIAIGVKHNSEDASFVLVTLDGGQVVTANVTEARSMDTPEAIAFSPDGTRATVSGSMLRVDTFDQAGRGIWSVRGGDNPFVASLAYADDDFFLGGGFTGGISLWSRDGTVLDADFDADLRRSFIGLTEGGSGEVFATDSDGTVKKLSFNVKYLEDKTLDILRNRSSLK